MQTLAKAALRSGTTGSPLPDIWPSLARNRIHFRRGGTSMIAGPPGAYKSTLALNALCQWAALGVTAIYVSADSDEFTVAKRCAAIITGDSMEAVEPTLRAGKYTDNLRRLSNVHWEFKGLDSRRIWDRLEAFEHMYGSFPDLLVVDNLMNCVEGPGDWNGQIQMCRDLDEQSRKASTHIMILHHTQEHKPMGGKAAPTLPPARWEIQGKVAQFPRLVLTMNSADEHMMIAAVKNTNGPQDPSGRTYTDFLINSENARVIELER